MERLCVKKRSDPFINDKKVGDKKVRREPDRKDGRQQILTGRDRSWTSQWTWDHSSVRATSSPPHTGRYAAKSGGQSRTERPRTDRPTAPIGRACALSCSWHEAVMPVLSPQVRYEAVSGPSHSYIGVTSFSKSCMARRTKSRQTFGATKT